MEFINQYLKQAQLIIDQINRDQIASLVHNLVALRASQGRLFILGVGGSAANASHAVNDFRKLVRIEAYAPTDNVSELTARTNDEGWDSVFIEWLKISRLSSNDALLIFSVGGGNADNWVSPNLVRALDYAKGIGSTILGIVGRNGGHTALLADACVIIPSITPESITPHTEAFQAMIWHLLVSHPELKLMQTKWESLSKGIEYESN